jgi:hypothetical protein
VPTLALSQANTELGSTKTIGITATSISNNSNGEIVVFGLADNLNTTAFTAGSALWLSPTVAGGMTMVKPSAPNHMVFIGFCTRSHPTAGTIEVKIQNGFELEELHNVAISSLVDNQVLKYDAPNSLWKNETLIKDDVGLENVANLAPIDLPISTATQTALDLITNVNWLGDYNNGVTYTVGDGVMFNGASFRMIISIGAAGYNPVAYPSNWLQITEYVSPNDIGLGNVPNVDATNPANIVQTSSYRFATDTEKGVWNGKQDALGFTPENVANKETNFAANTGSDIKYPTIKSIFTWIVGVLSGYQPALGFDPANDTLSNLGGTAVNNSINPDSNVAYALGASGLNWASVATKSILYDDNSPNYDVELRNFSDAASKDSLNYEARNLLDKSGSLVLDWDNCLIDKDRFALTGISFETVSKNLKQYDYTLTYTTGVLTKITYVVPSVGDITKTLNYTSGVLTSVVLSGSTPSSISLTKTLNYTSGALTSVTYS